MKTIRIEIRNENIYDFQLACIAKFISLGRLNWKDGECQNTSTINFTPIDSKEEEVIRTILSTIFSRELLFDNKICRIYNYSDRQNFIREDKVTGERVEVDTYITIEGEVLRA